MGDIFKNIFKLMIVSIAFSTLIYLPGSNFPLVQVVLQRNKRQATWKNVKFIIHLDDDCRQETTKPTQIQVFEEPPLSKCFLDIYEVLMT